MQQDKPLKAYIRLDGKNRPVSGTLVLRLVKPKIGKWKETQAYLCNGIIPPTTSTTSSTTTIAPVVGYPLYLNSAGFVTQNEACYAPVSLLTLYTPEPPGMGQSVYTDIACTLPFNGLDKWFRRVDGGGIYNIASTAYIAGTAVCPTTTTTTTTVAPNCSINVLAVTQELGTATIRAYDCNNPTTLTIETTITANTPRVLECSNDSALELGGATIVASMPCGDINLAKCGVIHFMPTENGNVQLWDCTTHLFRETIQVFAGVPITLACSYLPNFNAAGVGNIVSVDFCTP
jgi:hypothetical protein